MAPDRPIWQEEQQRLLAKIGQLSADLAAATACIDQLAADVQKAEARAVEFEKALAGRKETQSAEPPLSEQDLEVLRLKADARHNSGDYAGAAELYEQLAKQLKLTRGPGDPATLQAQFWRLEAET